MHNPPLILIADDNPRVRQALRQTIEAHKGWSVCCEAADGLQGIQEAERCKPDLIIIDLAMPQVNGLSAARTISELLRCAYPLYDMPLVRSDCRNVPFTLTTLPRGVLSEIA